MSIRTSRADQNFYSVSNNIAEWYSGTDRATPAPFPSPLGLTLMPPDYRNWDAILKLSDGTNSLTLNGLIVAQGRENALDCNNRVNHCALDGQYGSAPATGEQIITVKGGCHDLVIRGKIWSRGSNGDVVVGEWSDQCFNASVDLDFSGLTRGDGGPVIFVLARCRRVKLPPNARVLKWRSFCLSVYWWVKWVYVKVLKLVGR